MYKGRASGHGQVAYIPVDSSRPMIGGCGNWIQCVILKGKKHMKKGESSIGVAWQSQRQAVWGGYNQRTLDAYIHVLYLYISS